jgi:hypothetical protein
LYRYTADATVEFTRASAKAEWEQFSDRRVCDLAHMQAEATPAAVEKWRVHSMRTYGLNAA